MKILLILFFVPLVASVCYAENIVLSAATTDKKLILLNIEYANKKYRVVDSASFNLPFQAGLTAHGLLPNGMYQVVWTAQDATKKVKLHRMIIDKELNKVGNIKRFPRVLFSLFNLNFMEGSNQAFKSNFNIAKTARELPIYTYDISEDVWAQLASDINGNPIQPPTRIYTPPNGFDAFDSSLAVTQNGNIYYASLGYNPTRAQYGVVFGKLANSNYTSAFAFTGGPIVSEDLIPTSEKDKFNFVHVERLNNPVRYKILNRQFDGPTGQPDGALISLVAPYPGDLGQLAFFNMITVMPSAEESTGGHVFFIRLKASEPGTDIMVFHMNTETGKRNSPVAKLEIDDRLLDLLFKYGSRAGGITDWQ